MPGPASSARRRILLGALAGALLVGAAALVHGGRALRSDWSALQRGFEAARPGLAAALRADVVKEFWRRLPEGHAWGRSGGDDVGLLVEERARELLVPTFREVESVHESGPFHERFERVLVCRLDFPLPTIDAPPGELADAPPSVRFTDVRLRLVAERSLLHRRVEAAVEGGGAWLDERARQRILAALAEG